MSYHQDWLMRQIRQLIEVIARVLLGKDIRMEQAENLQWRTLRSVLKEKGVCAAENYLLDGFDQADGDWLAAGLAFYQAVNELTDQELESQNFSREEIREGLENLCTLAGMPNLADAIP